MTMAWTEGELLLTLYRERQFRLAGYEARPASLLCNGDAKTVDTTLVIDFPTTYHLESAQSGLTGITAEAIRRLAKLEGNVGAPI